MKILKNKRLSHYNNYSIAVTLQAYAELVLAGLISIMYTSIFKLCFVEGNKVPAVDAVR